jgi:hypothetical protein
LHAPLVVLDDHGRVLDFEIAVAAGGLEFVEHLAGLLGIVVNRNDQFQGSIHGGRPFCAAPARLARGKSAGEFRLC